MEQKPQVCTLLFLRRNEEILLGLKKTGFGKDYWNGVGGKLEGAESIEQALMRESQEEIGVVPTMYDKVAIHDFIFADTTKNMQMHTYVATAWEGRLRESEEIAPAWFHLSAIPYDAMWPDDLLWLPQILRGKKIAGGFMYDHGENLVGAEMRFVDQLP